MTVEITRRIEFDAAHRIPDHRSKCRMLHGHRYVLDVTALGGIINNPGESNHGMVIDFTDLKNVMMDTIGTPWDHALLLWDEDPLNCPEFHSILDESCASAGAAHKTVILPNVPTVENLAEAACELLQDELDTCGISLRISHLRLYETPNCWADIYPLYGPQQRTHTHTTDNVQELPRRIVDDDDDEEMLTRKLHEEEGP
jgi:6-pyruvoyltetrahydropterin/6-carboxytetrahydropterin synthase